MSLPKQKTSHTFRAWLFTFLPQVLSPLLSLDNAHHAFQRRIILKPLVINRRA